ncbi:hypothetical protein NC653_024349 [Populus alba x Populus x berolinensis]|uniref:AAA ATPase AAA+ lid domain-containing protein n=1 Tax=Populus alba x Populus x berolinensis TaxID=444605 RepID=A0AAD6M8I4_9ROSI|nr:hypothetical protein NC653_024349 [Populus alba x Populus x berolinensis]
MLAKAIVEESEVIFIKMWISNLMSKWFDDAQKLASSSAFEIGIPNQRERAEILKVVFKTGEIESKIDFDYIASLCEGYTSSDFLEPCKKAPRPLSQSDLQRVLGTSAKTRVAANEYRRSSSHSPRWPGNQMTIGFKP